MSALLALEDVAVRLGGRAVLDGVDLQVRAGEVVALVGRNGAGKTTLVRVASGVWVPERGRVTLAGRPLAGGSRRELARRVAVVPQQAGVPFPFSALEVVLMGRTPHLGLLGFEGEADRMRARSALERLGIADLAGRSVLELSGGERQLVMVARALTQDAELLLLDEPTAFLDLEHRLEVLGVVRELAARGRGALVVSHDLGLAARFCDRMAVLAGGRVLADGPPQQVLAPELLRQAFGIEAELLATGDGAPVVVPRRAATGPRRQGGEAAAQRAEGERSAGPRRP
ncbi:MAG: ABC transporter ATP-binding protein [Myxococcota bacterium]